jgi:oligoribonuclease NrnB/cAMP/cGMP phosphodiesterase (DHH superfamily)
MSDTNNALSFIPPTDVLCIYHGSCADGFGAAWVVHHYFGNTASFHAGHYGAEPPDVTGKVVFIVDFSYSPNVIIDMASKAKSITVLDHHKTAAEALADLPALDNVTVVLNMEHSGAAITWNHFFPEQHAPPLLKHIEDRDLWRFALDGTREIQAALFSYPYDFDLWNKLMAESYETVEFMRHDGIAIERKHHKDVAELLAATQRTMTIAGHTVPVANLPYTMSSDAGATMATDAPFAACYWDTPTGRTFSLRSRQGGEDVAAIAQQYGGGGHRNASGFRVPRGHELAVA